MRGVEAFLWELYYEFRGEVFLHLPSSNEGFGMFVSNDGMRRKSTSFTSKFNNFGFYNEIQFSARGEKRANSRQRCWARNNTGPTFWSNNQITSKKVLRIHFPFSKWLPLTSLVMTCSHVLRPTTSLPIWFFFPSGQWRKLDGRGEGLHCRSPTRYTMSPPPPPSVIQRERHGNYTTVCTFSKRLIFIW